MVAGALIQWTASKEPGQGLTQVVGIVSVVPSSVMPSASI